MAEVLGLAASVFTVLGITQRVLSICYDYGAAARRGAGEASQAQKELEGLRSILQTLEPLARKAGYDDPHIYSDLPALMSLCSSGVLGVV